MKTLFAAAVMVVFCWVSPVQAADASRHAMPLPNLCEKTPDKPCVSKVPSDEPVVALKCTEPPVVTPCGTDLPTHVVEHALRDTELQEAKLPSAVRRAIQLPDADVRRWGIGWQVDRSQVLGRPSFEPVPGIVRVNCSELHRFEYDLRSQTEIRLFLSGATDAEREVVRTAESLDDIIAVLKRYPLQATIAEVSQGRFYWLERDKCRT